MISDTCDRISADWWLRPLSFISLWTSVTHGNQQPVSILFYHREPGWWLVLNCDVIGKSEVIFAERIFPLKIFHLQLFKKQKRHSVIQRIIFLQSAILSALSWPRHQREQRIAKRGSRHSITCRVRHIFHKISFFNLEKHRNVTKNKNGLSLSWKTSQDDADITEIKMLSSWGHWWQLRWLGRFHRPLDSWFRAGWSKRRTRS